MSNTMGYRFVAKPCGKKHFTKDVGQGSTSDRIILPRHDRCGVKVTRFTPRKGFEAKDIVNKVDETVYIDSGRVILTYRRKRYQLGKGSTYHVPAGVKFALKVTADSVMICVYSVDTNPFSTVRPDNE